MSESKMGAFLQEKLSKCLINVVAMYCTYMYQSNMNVERAVIALFEDRNGTYLQSTQVDSAPSCVSLIRDILFKIWS